jgi:hypothetical protein
VGADRACDFYSKKPAFTAIDGHPVAENLESYDVKVDVNGTSGVFSIDNGHAGAYVITLRDLPDKFSLQQCVVSSRSKLNELNLEQLPWREITDYDLQPDGTVVLTVHTERESPKVLVRTG